MFVRQRISIGPSKMKIIKGKTYQISFVGGDKTSNYTGRAICLGKAGSEFSNGVKKFLCIDLPKNCKNSRVGFFSSEEVVKELPQSERIKKD